VKNDIIKQKFFTLELGHNIIMRGNSMKKV